MNMSIELDRVILLPGQSGYWYRMPDKTLRFDGLAYEADTDRKVAIGDAMTIKTIEAITSWDAYRESWAQRCIESLGSELGGALSEKSRSMILAASDRIKYPRLQSGVHYGQSTGSVVPRVDCVPRDKAG